MIAALPKRTSSINAAAAPHVGEDFPALLVEPGIVGQGMRLVLGGSGAICASRGGVYTVCGTPVLCGGEKFAAKTSGVVEDSNTTKATTAAASMPIVLRCVFILFYKKN